MHLVSTADKVQLVTASALNTDVHASYIDYNGTTVTPDRKNTSVTTAATTDIIPVPGSGVFRKIKNISIRNRDASASQDVTVKLTDGTFAAELIKATLLAGESLVYNDVAGWMQFDATGAFKNVQVGNTNALITNVEPAHAQRVFRSALAAHPVAAVGAFILITGTAYYVYIGRAVKDLTLAFVEYHVTTAGAGAQTAEVGLFTTPQAPNKAAQTLTKVAATGTLNALTATGVGRNTATLAAAIKAGNHIWAAIRTAMATTQPTLTALNPHDMSEGHILTTTGGGALTGLTTAAGALVAVGTALTCPELRVTLD